MRSSLFGRLFALFLVVPFVELALLVWIGDRVGLLPTLAFIVLTALVGSWLSKREGLAALRRFQARLAAGQLPGRELTDGLIILVSGALLLAPGVLTDVAGLLGLFPPTRALIRRRLEARVQRALASGRIGVFSAGRRFGPPPPPGPAPRPSSPERGVEDAMIVEERERGTTALRPPRGSP